MKKINCEFLDEFGACGHIAAPSKFFGKTPCVYIDPKRDMRLSCNVQVRFVKPPPPLVSPPEVKPRAKRATKKATSHA